MIDVQQEVTMAEKRIRPYIRQTPLDFSVPLSKITGSKVYLKCENLQYTNAFKVRGAFNKLLSLTPAQRKQGVVTASSGNHGTAMAFGSSQLNIPSLVFVPNHAAATKTVGADTPHKQELDESIFNLADVVVADSISQCLERGDIAHAIKKNIISQNQLIELGDIILGKSRSRTTQDQITVADLTGLAIQDIQMAKVIFLSHPKE